MRKGRYMTKWRCTVCDCIYDPEVGDPEAGIPPGTEWEDVPEDYRCPDCLLGKDYFEPIDEADPSR